MGKINTQWMEVQGWAVVLVGGETPGTYSVVGFRAVLFVWEGVGDGRSGTLMGRCEKPVGETPRTFDEADEVGGGLSSARKHFDHSEGWE